ncbi:MAG: hypothetical protein M1138_07025 [Candidatus Thermoplasmatota archaeon]|jgi:transposase|nr:hypothetical protein [Candidatus Thermoplasmatota archaeon]
MNEVVAAIHNFTASMLERRVMTGSNSTCGRTGYSLRVKEDSESKAQTLKYSVKEKPDDENLKRLKKCRFTYALAAMDPK